MKIEIHTTNATTLLGKIKEDVTDKKIKTWNIVTDANGKEYLTHNPEQWLNKALLSFSTQDNPVRLVLTITWFVGAEPNEYTKGLYIGRFTEELLEHYKKQFSKLETFA